MRALFGDLGGLRISTYIERTEVKWDKRVFSGKAVYKVSLDIRSKLDR